MKHLLLSVLSLLLLGQCKKIPERTLAEVRAISVNGANLQEGQGIELIYGTEADVVFTYDSKTGIEYMYIKMNDDFYANIDSSDESRVTMHPQKGDVTGSFTYRINTTEQFDPPVGNPILDKKALTVVMMNEQGVVEVFTISVVVL